MPITLFDILVVVVILVSAILAMIRGFVREVLSVTTWVAAAAAAYFFHRPFVPLIEPYIDSHTIAVIAAAAGVFAVTLIIGSYITMKISDFVIDSRAGLLDRSLGLVFGAVRGVLLLVIALLFFDWLVPRPPDWISSARSKPILDNVGEQLIAAMPQDIEATILRRLRGQGDTETPPAEEPDNSGDGAATQQEEGYAPTERQGLDRLFESGTR